MVRVIVRTEDACGAVNAGTAVLTSYKTFDIEAPELENFLRSHAAQSPAYVTREAVGVEVIG